jgi:hypothetical protein
MWVNKITTTLSKRDNVEDNVGQWDAAALFTNIPQWNLQLSTKGEDF